MDWQPGSGASVYPGEELSSEAALAQRLHGGVCHQQQLPSSRLCDCPMATLCQSQMRCVKASIVSSWKLAEAQDQLRSLGVHSSESLEQERARTLACPSELTHTEAEWHRKESMLGGQEANHSPELGAVRSWDVFDKSVINVHHQPVNVDQDKCNTFHQKYDKEIRHFGMLRRWDDSQRFLADMPQLICEETGNYLILWCMKLQQEGKEALMEQIAHQAVVMQFILEMASNTQQDPRGCFRQFFHKAKDGQGVYLEVFHTELEAFKHRVRECAAKCRDDDDDVNSVEQQNVNMNRKLDPKDSVAGFPAKRCLEGALWTSTGRWTKDEATETEDIRMMETS